jgi:uncharacterized alkaline shock family protein YloU
MLESKGKNQIIKLGVMLKSDDEEMGQIEIHENVIASIVRRVACGINGVKRLASKGHFVNNFAGFIGGKKTEDKGISISIDGNAVSIDLKVVLEYGVHIPTTASSIQSAVITEVEKHTGLSVSKVVVTIQELEDTEK